MYSDYLRSIITPIVDSPEEIIIEEKHDDRGILLSLTVAKRDMGAIVGKLGKNIESIRSLLRILGLKNNARVSIVVNEPLLPVK